MKGEGRSDEVRSVYCVCVRVRAHVCCVVLCYVVRGCTPAAAAVTHTANKTTSFFPPFFLFLLPAFLLLPSFLSYHLLKDFKRSVYFHKKHRKHADPRGRIIALCNEGLAWRDLGVSSQCENE